MNFRKIEYLNSSHKKKHFGSEQNYYNFIIHKIIKNVSSSTSYQKLRDFSLFPYVYEHDFMKLSMNDNAKIL